MVCDVCLRDSGTDFEVKWINIIFLSKIINVGVINIKINQNCENNYFLMFLMTCDKFTHDSNSILIPKSSILPYFESLRIFEHVINGSFIVLSTHEVSWGSTISSGKQQFTEIPYRKKS